MNKHIEAIFVIIISLLSATLFAQSSGINDNINRDIFGLSTKISPKHEKSSATFSIGAGYAGLTSKGSQPNGFDVQLDLIFPVTTYLAINGSFNYAGFPKYETSDGALIFYKGTQTNLNLSPGISFGNFSKNDKFNYFISAGLSLLSETTGANSIVRISDGQILDKRNGWVNMSIGALISGRVSYKVSKQFQLFLEPGYNTVWSDEADSYYHINGGVSIAL